MRMGTLRVGLTAYVGPRPQPRRSLLGTMRLDGDGLHRDAGARQPRRPGCDRRAGESRMTELTIDRFTSTVRLPDGGWRDHRTGAPARGPSRRCTSGASGRESCPTAG